jgi:DNA-binding transcriptional regulator YbjK
MPRRAEPDARRQSLIEAAMRVLARAGANGASVRAMRRKRAFRRAWSATISPGSTR